MFNVKLIREYPQKIKVYGYSKINSLVATVKDNTYSIKAKLLALLKTNARIKDITNIVIDKVRLITNPRLSVTTKDDIIHTSISSNEKIKSDLVYEKNALQNNIKSKEKIKNAIIDKTLMLLEPIVGYFKKLYEFDSKNLSELDNTTLDDMDYEAKLMAIDNEKEVM